MHTVTLRPIGVVRTPYRDPADVPIQPTAGADLTGQVVIDDAFAAGLADIDGFSHLYLLPLFHRAQPATLTVRPYLDDHDRGVFATRAPNRPNPLGLSLVRLIGREGATLTIAGVDLLDGTPLLDIKPYIPSLTPPTADVRIGWLTGKTGGFLTRTAGGEREP
jgi:tRNA (adenine37-N6)-methyltransferase